jgi:hypothetical protein
VVVGVHTPHYPVHPAVQVVVGVVLLPVEVQAHQAKAMQVERPPLGAEQVVVAQAQ